MTKTLTATILLLATIAVGFLYLKPEWEKFKNLRQETAELQDLNAEIDGLIENRDAIIQLINSISRNDLARIEIAMPQEPKASEFLVFLESLTLKNGFALKQLDLAGKATSPQTTAGQPRPGGIATPTKPAGAILEVPVVLSAAGPYDSLKRLLNDMEKNLRIIDIVQLSFQAPSRSNDPTIEFSMKLKTYYQ